ncbi:hypothetical protein [Cyanobium sp. NIES-981]|uniref:hypothetical protein n=1 Tax=Cyanobium sp. NIES-981 TaxID=1851505 RepID=UPI0007DCC0F1|nr:hypothetical protein [Cyanobium sp. NIES-981]SBO42306.1 conserved protein of unknown function [Cyanobium sp. NIES-981]
MGWDPSVLRRYNTTGHFRLLSQLRSELKANPLVRPKEGETIGEVNRSKGLIRAMESRGSGRSRRTIAAAQAAAAFPVVMSEATLAESTRSLADEGGEESTSATFRERLNAIELR